MSTSAKANIIRIGIPLLRFFPFWAALYGFAAVLDLGWKPFIVYAPPLQKVFYAPLVGFVWGALALVPFVLLRRSSVFYIYAVLFSCCLAFKAYDDLVPFRYVSPDYHGEIVDAGVRHSTSGNNDSIDYWISRPTFPPSEDVWLGWLVSITPLVLAFVYRRSYRLWAT